MELLSANGIGMSGWTKNPENFGEVFKDLRALKEAVKEGDLAKAQALVTAPDFHRSAITPALIDKALIHERPDIATFLWTQAHPDVQHGLLRLKCQAANEPQALIQFLLFVPEENRSAMAGQALVEGFNQRHKEPYFSTILDQDSIVFRAEDLTRPLKKWAASRQWALVVRSLSMIQDPSQVPWSELLLILTGQRKGPPVPAALAERIEAQVADPTQLTHAFKAAARTGEVAMLDRMMARQVPDWTPPLAEAFEAAWIKDQTACVDRLWSQVDFEEVGRLLIARILRQADNPTSSDKTEWAELDRLGVRMTPALQAQWLAEHEAKLPLTFISHRVHQAADSPVADRPRRRLRS
jgi:hypothetical protein